MKLLFVGHYFPLRGSGILRVYDLARFLVTLDNSVSVVSCMNLRDIFRVKAGEKIDNITVYRALSLDLRLSEVIIDVFQILSIFLLSLFVILREKVDFVIISVPPGVVGIGGFFAGKISRRKLVFDVRDRWEDHSIYFSKYMLGRFTHMILKKLFNLLYRKANLVISVTPSLVTYMKMRGCSKVAFIPNGADVKLFHPRVSNEKSAIRSELGLHDGDIALVYAGSIGAYYRPDIVIRAIHYLMEINYIPHIKFLIMGKGEPLKIRETLKLIEDLGLEHNVIFLGEQEREGVARILSCCDLGVVPYDDSVLWTSAYSTKFFEYCATGLPVIVTVTKDSDLATLVRKHKVGYVVDPLNIEQFASAVKEFCNLSEKEKKEMSDRARNLVVNFFDRREITKKLVETLQSV